MEIYSRTGMKIVDCFPYFNEKELLELRINMLRGVVDEFIICDGNRTHTGIPKPFTAKDTIRELGLDGPDIRVVEVNLPSIDQEPNAWVRERMQRNAAAEFITGDSVAIVSDCDEIIDPLFIEWYTNTSREHHIGILRIPMVFLNGRADLRVYDENDNPRAWTNPFICMKHHCNQYSLSEMRESHAMRGEKLKFPDFYITENDSMKIAGWHFSWMGDPERLKTKYRSYMHFNDIIERSASPYDKQKQLEFIAQYIPSEGATDPLGRDNHFLKKYPEDQLPKLIFNLPRVKQFLLPDVN
jgi:beta-1,4-mannosyl-glycoprotein beta-1,4-N-acetylglucosaminyltransferase